MRCAPLVGMFEPNLECENGHRFYAKHPKYWETTPSSLMFCINEACMRKQVRVRCIGTKWKYESPYVAHPPADVEETCED